MSLGLMRYILFDGILCMEFGRRELELEYSEVADDLA